MKTKILVYTLSLLVIFACSNDNNALQDYKTIDPDITDVFNTKNYLSLTLNTEEIQVMNNTCKFGVGIFERLLSEIPDKDIVISPLSVSLALSMLGLGAENATFNEIYDVTGFSGLTKKEIGELSKRIISNISCNDSSTRMGFGNAVVMNEETKLYESYTESIKNYYDADIWNDNSLASINAWCDKQSFGLIQDLPSISAEKSAVTILNATSFSSKWAVGKDFSRARKQFNHSDKKSEQTDFFTGKTICNYGDYQNMQVLQIPYAGDSFSASFFLPKEGYDYSEFAKLLIQQDVFDIASLTEPANVQLSIPVFESDCTVDLKSILMDAGIHTAFSPDADFSAMCDESLVVSKVLQTSKVIFNENGTEAASVTDIEMEFTSPENEEVATIPVFSADRPFVYAIVETSSNALLFLGVKR